MNLNIFAIILATSGALSIAVQSMLVRKGTAKTGTAEQALGVTIPMTFVFYLFYSITVYYPVFRITKISMVIFIAHGVLSFFLGNLFKFSGIEKIGAARTSPIVRTQVFFSTLIAVGFLGEELTLLHLIGIMVLTSGAVLVSRGMTTYEGNPGDEKRPLIHLVFPFLAAFFFGLAKSIVGIGLGEGTPITVGLSLSAGAGGSCFIAYSTVFRPESLFSGFRSENKVWFILAGIANIALYTFIFSALKIARVVVAVPFLNTVPLFVLTMSYFLLPRLEEITPMLIVGSVLVVGGATLIRVFM